MLSPFTALLLFLAAVLEAGGDALVRKGLHATASARTGFFLAGAVLLFAYGYFVNSPPWDFGRLLGVYVVFFFLVAQAIGWIFFGQAPSSGTLMGGGLILAGGIVVFARG
jgi:small multidrug resistance family-3 protein